MQKVAAYLLERREGMQWPEARTTEIRALKVEVEKWLTYKGASALGSNGDYRPEDGSSGSFHIDKADDGERAWWMVQLQEVTTEGRRVLVSLSITSCPSKVSVYVTVEAGWTTTGIMPVSIDPKCPRIVRNLLALEGNWYHGSSMLQKSQVLSGFDSGEALAAEILHVERAVPIIVVSTDDGIPSLPDLDRILAYDLAGIANVIVLDDEAAWGLTDALGRDFSCYRGAVRLYWPRCAITQDRYLHPLWTADRLRFAESNPLETRERLRLQLRRMLFRAAALSVVRPRDIDEIRDAARLRPITELRQHASSLEEYETLADSYSKDNDQLRLERKDLRDRVDDLAVQVAKLEADRQALLTHLRAARAPFEQPTEELTADKQEEILAPPENGEIRFYKKAHSLPARDVMVRVADCGCNNWQTAHAADKARKGIAKLENGRSDWRTLQHCASCTDGGMWRVRW